VSDKDGVSSRLSRYGANGSEKRCFTDSDHRAFGPMTSVLGAG
jgi:hypothetical protein